MLAAAAAPSLGAGKDIALLLLAVLVLAGLYLGSCRIWPYGPCLKCLGNRRNPGSSRKRHGRCKVCRGTGERLRIGTRLMRSWSGGRWPR